MGTNSKGGGSSSLSLDAIADHLLLYNNYSIKFEHDHDECSYSKLNRASVLICLFEDDHGDFRVILTKRSSSLSSHSGEVSLPGGKTEEGDADDVETALREAQEEIGLDPLLVNVVAVLESFTNKMHNEEQKLVKVSDVVYSATYVIRWQRGMTVIPIVGILKDKKAFNPIPNPNEVESIFDAPLEMFLKDENRTEEEREWMGAKYLLHYFDYEAEDHNKYVIWAITAGILIKVASLVYQRPPAFAERTPTFWHKSHKTRNE